MGKLTAEEMTKNFCTLISMNWCVADSIFSPTLFTTPTTSTMDSRGTLQGHVNNHSALQSSKSLTQRWTWPFHAARYWDLHWLQRYLAMSGCFDAATRNKACHLRIILNYCWYILAFAVPTGREFWTRALIKTVCPAWDSERSAREV